MLEEKLESAQRELEKEREEKSTELTSSSESLNAAKSELESLSSKATALEEKLQATQRELKKEREEKSAELVQVNQRLKSKGDEVTRSAKELESLNQKLKAQELELDSASKEKVELKARLEETCSALDLAKSQVQDSKHAEEAAKRMQEGSVQQLQQSQETLAAHAMKLSELASIKEAFSTKETQVEQLGQAREKLNGMVHTLESQLALKSEEIKKQKLEIQELSAKVSENSQNEDMVPKSELVEAKSSAFDANSLLSKSEAEVKRLSKELKKLKSSPRKVSSKSSGTGIAAGAQCELKHIKGVGKVIEGLLNEKGIHNCGELAKAKLSDLKEVVQMAGSRYKKIIPRDLQTQAKLVVQGKVDQLKQLVAEIKSR